MMLLRARFLPCALLAAPSVPRHRCSLLRRRHHRRLSCVSCSTLALARKAGQSAQSKGVSTEEAWKSWQCHGLSMNDIAGRYKTTREAVFRQLVVAVEAGMPIDWAALCSELGVSGAVAAEVYKSLPKSADDRFRMTPGLVKRLNNAEITTEQIRVCVLMLERGFSIDDIKAVICLQPGYFASASERLQVLCGEMQKSRNIRKEFFRVSQGRKLLLDQGLMDLIRDRNGASLVEIAAFFSDCDQKHLVDLLYSLEKSGNIAMHEGKYKVVNMSMFQ